MCPVCRREHDFTLAPTTYSRLIAAPEPCLIAAPKPCLVATPKPCLIATPKPYLTSPTGELIQLTHYGQGR